MNSEELYKTSFQIIYDGYFEFNVLEQEIDKIDTTNRIEFLEFIKIEFRKKSIKEWMNDYEIKNRIKNVNEIPYKKETEEYVKHYNRIITVKYDETIIGLFAFGNLELFEQKCVNKVDELKLLQKMKLPKNYNEAVITFDYSTNIEYAKTLSDNKNKLIYFNELLKNYKNNIKNNSLPDPGLYSDKPSYKKLIKNEIKLLKQKIELDNELLNIVDERIKKSHKTHKKKHIPTEEIDQDLQIEKFENECKNKQLVAGKTIPPNILYDIAKNIGMKVPSLEDFKSGESTYQIAREYASRTGYKRKLRRN